jgi:hypothetical protein
LVFDPSREFFAMTSQFFEMNETPFHPQVLTAIAITSDPDNSRLPLQDVLEQLLSTGVDALGETGSSEVKQTLIELLSDRYDIGEANLVYAVRGFIDKVPVELYDGAQLILAKKQISSGQWPPRHHYASLMMPEIVKEHSRIMSRLDIRSIRAGVRVGRRAVNQVLRNPTLAQYRALQAIRKRKIRPHVPVIQADKVLFCLCTLKEACEHNSFAIPVHPSRGSVWLAWLNVTADYIVNRKPPRIEELTRGDVLAVLNGAMDLYRQEVRRPR